jgi:hypothetical protein
MFTFAPPANGILLDGSTNFMSLIFTNSSQNLLGVGWLERAGATNLYNTLQQHLVTYSMAHDTMFLGSAGKVIAGGFSFTVPAAATNGQTYRIQVARPSATSDGIGAPGSDIYISTPTNGSLAGGILNSIKNVTVGQRRYVTGDAYPFRWFNAGDYGDGYLKSADVMQVFQSAIYGLNSPPPGSDFEDAMDSCCGAVDTSTNGMYLYPTSVTNSLVGGAQLPLYDANDQTINSVAFGDGELDVADVYVTFRRSLDSSLTWYQRFWTNGVRGAVTTPNVFSSLTKTSYATLAKIKSAVAVTPAVTFTAGDAMTGPGQTVAIPITASIAGNYPLRVLMLNLSVEPLDGSPALTTPVQFTAVKALGTAYATSQKGANNFAAVWLDSSIAGLTGNAAIGTLLITLPAGAPTNAAYAVTFEHVSASPNGISLFPKTVATGLITLGDRSGSSWHDGISDAWRLRNFGSIYNQLSAAHADADSDGDDNLKEFKTGTNPNDAKSVLRMLANTGAFNVRWPSVLGKTYIIERSVSLYGGVWTTISTNSGTGGDLQVQDSSNVGGRRFYRVRVE